MKIVDDLEWRICAVTQHVVDDRGLRIEADAVAESLNSYDVFFVPGGFGIRGLQHDHNFVEWLKTAHSALWCANTRGVRMSSRYHGD
jgi:cyclohexyl-isocyanide hydratase